jgi:quercetin dioxygenase-like cupin family protein
MKIYTFGPVLGRPVTEYGSQGVTLTPVLAAIAVDYLACFHLEPHVVIGRHEAASNQLLLVIGGDAVVAGEDRQAAAVGQGDAILWQQGEEHETRAGAGGLTAVVLEGSDLLKPDVLRLRPRDTGDSQQPDG